MHDSHLKSLISDAADFHGNVEWSAYDGCVIKGAVALGGDHNSLRNSHVFGHVDIHQGQPIRFREMLGFNFEISNVTGRTLANPMDVGGTGAIDVGGNNSSTLTANTTRGGTLRITNLHLDAPNATSGIRFVNRGCTQDLDIVVAGFSPRLDAANTTYQFGYLRLDNLSGGNFRSLTLEGLSNPDRIPISSRMDVDDSPTGRFTPTITFGGGSTGIMYGHQVGQYEVNRDTVTWCASVLLTSKGTSTGNAMLNGLPFTIGTFDGNLASPATLQVAELTYTGIPAAVHLPGTTLLALQQSASAGAISALTNTNFENTTRLRISGSYKRV